MPKGRAWTKQEIEYLEEKWGYSTIKTMAEYLNRTETAIKLKGRRLELGAMTCASDYVNVNQVVNMLNVDSHTVVDVWIKNHGLKAKKINLTGNKLTWRIKIDDLINWLKHNQDKWDSYRVEMFALGCEPDWLKDKRKRDALEPRRKFYKYTRAEDMKIIHLFKRGIDTKKIALEINRSHKSVERRLSRLDILGTGEYVG